MIDALNGLEKRTAAGVLARAALALESAGNPAAFAKLEGENALRDALLKEARARLGVAADDQTPETIAKVGDFLDEESEQLLEPPDTNSALERLAERGELASDLYRIDIIPNIQEFHGKNFPLERSLIERTVTAPDREQHYGLPKKDGDPFLISLFYRRFWTPWPFKNFAMLVAGQREKLVLHVHQAWRLYGDLADGQGAPLVEMLRRFADAYGVNVEVGGQRGHFFLHTDVPVQETITYSHGEKRNFQITVSRFVQNNPLTGRAESSLIIAIDLIRYEALLKKMAVRSNQIV